MHRHSLPFVHLSESIVDIKILIIHYYFTTTANFNYQFVDYQQRACVCSE